MKTIVILTALGALAAFPAHGQTVASPVPIAQPAARAGTIESARKLIEVMHVEQTYDRIFGPLTGLMAASVLPTLEKDPSVPAKVRAELDTNEGKARIGKIIKEEFYASIRARYGKMKEATAKEYAAVFSEDDLQAIIAFYSSGAGAKALALMPEISVKMQAYGEGVGREAGAEAYQHFLDRLDPARGT